ncbi:MAG: L,D-transpeptidase family protein [Anaerolineales bacterium]
MHELSRRAFIRIAGASLSGLALPASLGLPGLAESGLLARITEPEASLHSRPRPESPIVGSKSFDELLVINREVIGRGVYPHNHLWYETPEGFLWSSLAQSVRNQLNPILNQVPAEGLWTEVTVPFVDGLRQPGSASPLRYRLYYGMVLNVDARIADADGTLWYRVHDENGVVMYAPGAALRPITAEEIAPLSSESEDKRVVVNITRQELSAFESGIEVYFARISSGSAYYPEGGQFTSNTPIGQMWTWRKMVSRHMSGGDAVSGYDLPGVGWTVLFHGSGAALHSTYWHGDYGASRSRGCINLRPEDAKWLFRWTDPIVAYRPGDLTVQWPNPGTRVIVEI